MSFSSSPPPSTRLRFSPGVAEFLRFHERVAVVVGRRDFFGGSRLEIKAALASEAITWFVVLSGESGSWFKSFFDFSVFNRNSGKK